MKSENFSIFHEGPSLPLRTTRPIVDTEWLEAQIDNPDTVVIDLRDREHYTENHIPGAINMPAPQFSIVEGNLLLMLPPREQIFTIIGAAGVKKNDHVIIMHNSDHPYSLADTARAADTLIYAGIRNVSLLNGGYDKWCAEKRRTTREEPSIIKKHYESGVYPGIFVTKEYVEERLGKCRLIDARDPAVYFGVTTEPFAPRPGHIPTALSLPTPWYWNSDGTYKEEAEIREMAEGIAGSDRTKEIILYCGAGGFGSVGWFILHEVLGYTNVKLYDGSAQEWAADPSAPLTRFNWE